MINCYHKGDRPRVSAEFEDSSGNAVDPTTLTFKYTDPSGNVSTLEYGGSPADIVKDSTGNYHIDIDADEAGEWFYKWIATGNAQGGEPGQFKVLPDQY